MATGVVPRALKIEGSNSPQVLSYAQVLEGAEVGRKVAVIGAGGIGFDVSEFYLNLHINHSLNLSRVAT